MLELLRGLVGETLWPVIFLVVFLIVGGGALWLTPRIAKWLDKRASKSTGYFDDMLDSDPNASTSETSGE